MNVSNYDFFVRCLIKGVFLMKNQMIQIKIKIDSQRMLYYTFTILLL